MEFIKYSKDIPHLKTMLSNLKDKKLTNETVSTINLFTGAGIKLDEKGEVTDMCLAIEGIKREAVAEEFVKCVESAMESFHVSLEDACKGLKHTVEEYENAKKLLENVEVWQYHA